MFKFYIVYFLINSVAFAYADVHDEIPECGLVGIYKTRQTVLQSPNYPQQYPPNTCWDYVVRSPYRCPTKFHIQFLDFSLESSQNCSNDYLAIGLNNVGDNLERLCGQFVGIKKYQTPDGLLRLRFYADNSVLTTGKGFKLIVTRLACENSNILRELQEDETLLIKSPNSIKNLPDANPFGNFSLLEQYPTLTHYPANQIPCPTHLPIQAELAEQWQTQAILRANELQRGACCRSSFNQENFYLSSPGFPRTVITSLLTTQRRDCYFELQKFSQNVCRLRIEFKFFDFGQPSPNAANICAEDFLEIEGIRYCGCHTGFISNLPWIVNSKFLRLRMGFSGLPSNGFLLHIKQEQCPEFRNNLNYVQVPVSAFYAVQQPQATYYASAPTTYNPLGSVYSGFRQARAAKYMNLETNFTRKTFTYADDESKAQARSDVAVQNNNLILSPRNSCTFDSADLFQLLADVLWLRKPNCITPQRNLLQY